MLTHDRPPRRRHAGRFTTALGLAAVFSLALSGQAGATPLPLGPASASASSAPAASTTPVTSPDPAGGTDTAIGCGAGKPHAANKLYAQCFAVVHRRRSQNGAVPADTAPPSGALGPAQIQAAYNLPASGSAQTVAIVDAFGYPTAEADLAVFRSQYGLAACTTANGCFQKVDQTGGTNYPAQDPGWAGETALDLDAVSSACPGCHILLVEANDNSDDNLGAAVDTAVAMGAKFVSNSYGSAEASSETAEDHYYDHPGVAVVASTGDTGNETEWPSTDPNVVAVGGTTLTQDSSARGWHESAWGSEETDAEGAGSGCSPVEPQPAYQADVATDCADRAVADISADADPNTGLAVYDSQSDPGICNGPCDWFQVGGTSLAAPLITAMYALAGAPTPNSNPASAPYTAPAGSLNDVTDGTNGTCGTVLCTAGPGWDGPTGMGTPNGVSALSEGPRGDIVGTVTNASTGSPVAGVTVASADGYSTETDSTGHFDLNVSAGSHDITATDFGYQSATDSGVSVSEGASITLNFALTPMPTRTVSGTVTDGSGHGYPLYSKITIDGYPKGPVYTDPFTGRYSVRLPQTFATSLHVTPVASGYTTTDVAVDAGSADLVDNVSAPVDTTSCTAPGYGFQTIGTSEDFTGWTDTTTQDGWTNADNLGNGEAWRFDDPEGRSVSDSFAVLDSYWYAQQDHSTAQDASLVSPVIDLTGATDPSIQFDTVLDATDFFGPVTTADVDLSLDSGTTWSTVWQQGTADIWTEEGDAQHISIPIPQADGVTTARIRFHFTFNDPQAASHGYPWWGVDNVIVGSHTCSPTAGGLLEGLVSDANTRSGVNGATVALDGSASSITTLSAPGDTGTTDGFYSTFLPAGNHSLSVSATHYVSARADARVAADTVTRHDLSLKAGRLRVTRTALAATEQLGARSRQTVRLTNDGTAPIRVTLSEEGSGNTPAAAAAGAPLQQISGTFSTSFEGGGSTATAASRAAASASPAAAPWTSVADYPLAIQDNAVAVHAGKIYSVGGYTFGTINPIGTQGPVPVAELANDAWVYDPTLGSWQPIADLPNAPQLGAAAFVGGKLYVIGGWDPSGAPTSTVYVYDPVANTWSTAASMPGAVAAAGIAVLDGSIYVVGGCTANCFPASSHVYRYDPASNTWASLLDYSTPVAYTQCGGIADEVVCAGGDASDEVDLAATYVFHPSRDVWAQAADLPTTVWGAVASAANGKLQVSGGVVDHDVSNQGFQYDPASDTWSALPNANVAAYRAGGGCGIYQVGGSDGSAPMSTTEVLPGYDQCDDSAWLTAGTSSVEIGVGRSVTVNITMDSSVESQPGVYRAGVFFGTDSPYTYNPIQATMTVKAPWTWGKIAGTVTDDFDGTPIAGVTIQLSARSGTTYTLRTNGAGQYQLWLNAFTNSQLDAIVTKDDYESLTATIHLRSGRVTTTNFALTFG